MIPVPSIIVLVFLGTAEQWRRRAEPETRVDMKDCELQAKSLALEEHERVNLTTLRESQRLSPYQDLLDIPCAFRDLDSDSLDSSGAVDRMHWTMHWQNNIVVSITVVSFIHTIFTRDVSTNGYLPSTRSQEFYSIKSR